MAARFHRHLRARPGHPTPARPRPALVNTWEAVYFGSDTGKLLELADEAAALGIERFVLDDGWFRGRRSEQSGLGDWYVDPEVWPKGLHPLVDHVRGLGMEFGLWVEPESVSPDSDLARSHPDWLLATGGRMPPLSRQQQVLDLGHPGAWEYLLERLDGLLTEYDDRVPQVGHEPRHRRRRACAQGRARRPPADRSPVRAARRAEAPAPRAVEIESCAGGGGRIDLGILERTDRVWTSDSNDALERQSIQRWTGLLVPPELLGAHVGAEHAHTTGRVHGLDFRAGTALFGHFGLELDLTTLDAVSERRSLAGWRCTSASEHSCTPGEWCAVTTPTRRCTCTAWWRRTGARRSTPSSGLQTPVTQPPGRIRLPGLDPAGRYRLRLLEPACSGTAAGKTPPWFAAAEPEGAGLEFSGRILAAAGIQAPFLRPESLLLLHLTRSADR